MKFAIILGRGIEGCGVTRHSTLLHQYLQNKGHVVYSFASKDRKRPRKNSIEHSIVEFSNNEIGQIQETINQCDFVYYASLPSKSHSKEYCDLFREKLVCGITKPIKVGIQHDHKIQSINRNFNVREIFMKMDMIFTHSINSIFCERIVFLGFDKTKIFTMWQGYDFDSVRHLIKQTNELEYRLTYFGRFATFKDPYRLLKFHEQGDIKLTALGLERSLGALPFFYEDIKEKKKRDNIVEHKELNEGDNNEGKIDIYGPYDNIKGLEYLSKSAFACDFYNLKQGYGISMEYCMLEILAVGVIPVFDLHRAQNTKFGNGHFSDLNNFAIYSNKNDIQKTLNEMKELYNNKEALKERRKSCYEIGKNYFSMEKSFDEFLQKTLLFTQLGGELL